jgi:hypothetical protein
MQHIKNKYYKKTGTIFLPVFLFFALTLSGKVLAQKHEFGLGLGGFNYTGDISPRYDFLNYRPAGTIFYRYNPSWVTSIKIGFTAGNLAGTEKRSNEPVAGYRTASFRSTLTEGSVMGEYNFINYRDKKQLIKFSPYLTAGLAIYSTAPDVQTSAKQEDWNTGLNLAIPFGLGVKFILNRYWNLGTEFIARKTFSDYLDGMSKGELGHRATANPGDTDWYFYTGISISYTIYKVNCPQEYKY